MKTNKHHAILKDGKLYTSDGILYEDQEKVKKLIKKTGVCHEVIEFGKNEHYSFEWPGVKKINVCLSDCCTENGACEYCREPSVVARLIAQKEDDHDPFEDMIKNRPQGSEPLNTTDNEKR